MSDESAFTDQMLALTRRLIDAIDQRNFEEYRRLSAEDLTSFEPESKGHLIEGMAFHEFFLSRPHRPGTTARSEIVGFTARPLGGDNSGAPAAAMVAYTRITQKHDADGSFRMSHANETRVYIRAGREWRQAHFHRTEC